MKLAFLPYLNKGNPEPLPPPGYGSVNRVVHHLSEEMVRRGHDVTVFAPEGTKTSGRLVTVLPKGLDEIDLETKEGRDLRNGIQFSANVRILDELVAGGFDVIHCHDLPKIALMLRGRGLPLLMRQHSPPDTPYYARVYETLGDSVAYHFVSAKHEQNALANGCGWSAGYAYHGVETEELLPGDGSGGYALYIGKIHPAKGVKEAVEMARAADVPIVLAGPIKSARCFGKLGVDDDKVKYVGVADWDMKRELYRNASAFINYVQIEEAFGLTMAESFACGTPVIGSANGSLPEVIDDGVTGYVVGSVEEGSKALKRVRAGEISREACRNRAENLFSIEAMGERYEALFARFLEETKAKAVAKVRA